jgi:Zn-dependent protease with chaperone function
MKRPVEVIFYNGALSEPKKAFITPLSEQSIMLKDEQLEEHQFFYKDMDYIGAVGNRKPLIELPHDQRIEFLGKSPSWLAIRQKELYHAIWQLERSPFLIFLSMILVITTISVILKWGIPYSAEKMALWMPERTLQQLGEQTEQRLLAKTQGSTLSKAHQQRLTQLYQVHIAEKRPAEIIFRKGGSMGANAAAMPHRRILVTDELVQIAGTDEEVVAVLAHEHAHLELRHSMQKVISNVGVIGLFHLLTGDMSEMVTASVTLLSNAQYSQRFEMQADDYAMHKLHAQGISSIHLSNFLQRVENARILSNKNTKLFKVIEIEEVDGISDENKKRLEKALHTASKLDAFMGSHPSTEKRIERIHAFDAKMQQQ